MPSITNIKARKILNSRGEWTLEVLAESGDFQAKVGIPSGASVGKYEAKTIEIERAVKNVNEIIAPKLKGQDPTKQKEIDNLLIELDTTEDKSNLGANAIVGASMAVCRLGASIQNIPLWSYINQLTNLSINQSFNLTELRPRSVLPRGCFNIINGGKHAGGELAIQEFMIVPQYESFKKNLEIAVETYHRLKKLLKEKIGRIATNIGDEGGFVPPISSTIEALEFLKEAIEKNTKIILDCAATHFYKNGEYYLEGAIFTKEGLLSFYSDLIKKYPIVGLEDPFAEDDFEGWEKANSKLQTINYKLLIIGDDLTVTNPKRIKMAKEKNLCNGVIIKINQIGTISKAIEAAKLAKFFGWKIIVSHRSGETNDDFVADFAVGILADFVKFGAPARGERVAKYNRLLEIEEEIEG
ncbi:MAG: enolase [Candidatus Pacebacteria bacterium]|nr:enolase [Candidatus Paceibacterota bacterium]